MVVLCVATLPHDSHCQDEPELKLPDPFDADSGQEEEEHGASTHDDDGLTTSNVTKNGEKGTFDVRLWFAVCSCVSFVGISGL